MRMRPGIRDSIVQCRWMRLRASCVSSRGPFLFFQVCGAQPGLVNGRTLPQPAAVLGNHSKGPMSTAVFAPGSYRFIPAVFQYSGGVAAEPGFEIVRVRFHKPAPLAEGFA